MFSEHERQTLCYVLCGSNRHYVQHNTIIKLETYAVGHTGSIPNFWRITMDLFVHYVTEGKFKKRLRKNIVNYLFYSMITLCILGILFSIIFTINNLTW